MNLLFPYSLSCSSVGLAAWAFGLAGVHDVGVFHEAIVPRGVDLRHRGVPAFGRELRV